MQRFSKYRSFLYSDTELAATNDDAELFLAPYCHPQCCLVSATKGHAHSQADKCPGAGSLIQGL